MLKNVMNLHLFDESGEGGNGGQTNSGDCLLYTSDAADE